MQRPRSSVARKCSRRLVQSIVPPALHDPGATVLVSRFRSSHHCAAHSLANFGIKGTLAIYDSSAVFGFEVPTQIRGQNDRNFKSTALAQFGHGGNALRQTLAMVAGARAAMCE